MSQTRSQALLARSLARLHDKRRRDQGLGEAAWYMARHENLHCAYVTEHLIKLMAARRREAMAAALTPEQRNRQTHRYRTIGNPEDGEVRCSDCDVRPGGRAAGEVPCPAAR